MAEQQKPPGKGRGALLMEAFRKGQNRPGQDPPDTLQPSEPPKPRGRAALLQKLAERTQSRTSTGESSVSVSPTETVAAAVKSVTQTMATTTISEPCLFRGSSGSEISISCNYIRFTTDPNKGIFEYYVQFEPQVDAKNVRTRLIRTHLQKVRMFDGGTMLYLPTKLPQEKTDYKCTHPNDGSEIIMTLKFIKQKKMSECLQFFNILFKNVMHELLLSPIGRNYFDPNHSHLIPAHKLEVLPGYAVAVDEYEGGVMLCCDTQHRVMRTQNVLDALIELRCMSQERFKDVAMKSIVASTVLTKYNNRSYRIDDILWNLNPRSTFKTFDGRTISYMEYYKTQYNLDIKDEQQPLLLNMKHKKLPQEDKKEERIVCLVPELCYLTGLTDEMRSDFKVMKDVAMYTRVTPNQRMNALRTYIDNIERSPKAKETLSNWGLALENATIDLLARVVDAETILFGNGVKIQAEKAEWNNLVTRNKVLGPIDLRKWTVFYTKRDERTATNFVDTILRIANPMGMRIDKPNLYLLKDDRTDTYVTTLKTAINPDCQMLVFICPTSRDDRYSAIKRLCCVQSPIPTQVIISRTLSNPTKMRTIVQKIALQMNCKLGGTLWSVRFPVVNWMVCGIDVFHSPGSKQSVCAFVSSTNESFTRWWSMTIFQEQELGDQIKTAFLTAITYYRNINAVFPTNVIIFRDGLSDGALKYCLEYEVAQLENALVQFNGPKIKLTMIVVQKRINTRLFCHTNEGLDNPQPGTIIDHTITKRNWYDFYLVAQQVRQGTVTPTHYIVLHDAANLKPDHVQKLAYKLCHLYYNWPGTIRVPAPCQYAHKLAFLVGQHIRTTPAAVLSEKLFYL